MSQIRILLATVATMFVSNICNAQFITPPLTLDDSIASVSQDRRYAEIVVIAPSVYTTGDPIPLGTHVDFRVFLAEKKNGKLVLTPLQVVSGTSGFVGVPPQPMQVSLPRSTQMLQLAIVAVVDGMASEPTTQNLVISPPKVPVILVSGN